LLLLFDGVHGDVPFNEAVVAGAWFAGCPEGTPRCEPALRGRSAVFWAWVVGAAGAAACGGAGPFVAVAAAGADAAGFGAGAAVAGADVAVPGVGFADAGAAVRPEAELCPAGCVIDPAGQGVVFWPTATAAEIRNKQNHLMFLFNFIVTSKKDFLGLVKETMVDVVNVEEHVGQIHIDLRLFIYLLSFCSAFRQRAKQVGWHENQKKSKTSF
jgi:hypothetical protein